MMTFNKNSVATLALAAIGIMTSCVAEAQVLNNGAPKASSQAPSAKTATQPQPANADTAYSQTTHVYDNWSVQCRQKGDLTNCFAMTVVRQTQPKPRDIVTIQLSKADKGFSGMIVTPNGVKLDRGVKLTVGKQVVSASYSVCGPTSCLARFDAPADFLSALGGESQLSVLFSIFSKEETSGEKEIKIPVSLNGFTSAYADLNKAK